MIASFRERYPEAIPSTISNEVAARLLAILNTNQVELETICGSGLFVVTAILEHSCCPNCSFSTNNDILYLTAIKDITVGDRLSIDYGNNFYRPTEERQRELLETYGFTCSCPQCTTVDLTRPFKCRLCKTGVLYPNPSFFTSTVSFTNCNSCYQQINEDYAKVCLSSEEYLLNNPPETKDEVDILLKDGQ